MHFNFETILSYETQKVRLKMTTFYKNNNFVMCMLPCKILIINEYYAFGVSRGQPKCSFYTYLIMYVQLA